MLYTVGMSVSVPSPLAYPFLTQPANIKIRISVSNNFSYIAWVLHAPSILICLIQWINNIWRRAKTKKLIFLQNFSRFLPLILSGAQLFFWKVSTQTNQTSVLSSALEIIDWDSISQHTRVIYSHFSRNTVEIDVYCKWRKVIHYIYDNLMCILSGQAGVRSARFHLTYGWENADNLSDDRPSMLQNDLMLKWVQSLSSYFPLQAAFFTNT
jgi:hypothetical protein